VPHVVLRVLQSVVVALQMAKIIATVLAAVCIASQSAVGEDCCASVKEQLLAQIAGLQTLADSLGKYK